MKQPYESEMKMKKTWRRRKDRKEKEIERGRKNEKKLNEWMIKWMNKKTEEKRNCKIGLSKLDSRVKFLNWDNFVQLSMKLYCTMVTLV